MKPIHLKLAGLQSYRETQEIDFRALCEMGLFGIFGPTGSGKSTVLDAITLAMYGKVERASGGTQGIMNHSENQLSVSFTFELSTASSPKRYRVERRFKRTNEISVSNTVSRFIEMTTEGEVVVADKLADVTRCVEDIIGLTLADFTRAVVLPQGKFAEFLSLKGSDRRQMLQRLFHLEKYGDDLNIKLSRRFKDTEIHLKEISAEQQGLGDASLEALQAAEAALQTAREQALEQRAKRSAAEETYVQLKQIRERQSEKAQLHEQLNELLQAEPHIVQLEQNYSRAEAAGRLLPILVEFEQAKQHAEERKIHSESAKQAEQDAIAETLKLKGQWEQAQQMQAEQEPRLLVRIEQLEQAKQLELEKNELEQDTNRIKRRKNEAVNEAKLITEQLNHQLQQLEKAGKRQAEIKELLKGSEVRAEWRQALQMADRMKHNIGAVDRQRQTAMSELQQAVKKLESSDQAIYHFKLKQERLAAEWLELANAGTAIAADFREQELALESLQQGAGKWLEQLRHSQREQELQRLSIRLAQQVVPGEPCPVCGSVDHPQLPYPHALTTDFDSDPSSGEQEIAAAEQLVQQMNDTALKVRHSILRLQSIQQSMKLPGVDAQTQQEVQAAPTEPYTPVNPDINRFTEREQLQAELKRCRERETDAHANLAALEQDVHQAANRMREAEHQAVKQRADHDAQNEVIRTLQLKLTGLENELSVLHSDWQRDLPHIPVDQVEQLAADVKQKDEQTQELQERLERSIPFIEQTNQRAAQYQQQVNELDKELVQLHAQFEGKEQQLMDKIKRLQLVVGEQSADLLLQEAQSELIRIRTARQQLKLALDHAQQRENACTQQAAAAVQAALSAKEHEEQTQRNWMQQLDKSMFAPEDDVRNYYLTEEQQYRIAAEIKLHRETEQQLKAQIQRVDLHLAGQQVSEEQWQQCVQYAEEQQQLDEEAVRAKAKAERDADELTRKHVRWTELEQQRVLQQEQLERLGKLQSVFRGNTFVEFIAEEQLMQVSRAASERLRFLTKQRYALEVDSAGGFVICDDANGGVRRPVSTLSGGETFLTSLALALALSAQIQLQGQYPLQFFFLDEGFGTLDPELLETVITALEKLHLDQLTVGIISHVPELRARLPRKLIVLPAGPSGEGSRIQMEML